MGRPDDGPPFVRLTDGASGKWKAERNRCERCGRWQVAVHPDLERYQCGGCGYMMQSVPCKRDFDDGLED